MFIISGLKSRLAVTAVGKVTFTDSSRIMLKLASMNEASRKNIMSISGIISIRAFLCGNGEPIFIYNGSVTEGVGVSPHFFRRHRLEKNAGLTPTPAVTDRILHNEFHEKARAAWRNSSMNTARGLPAARFPVWPAAMHNGLGASDRGFNRTRSGTKRSVHVV